MQGEDPTSKDRRDRRPRFSFAWFTGADQSILAGCRRDRIFYEGLGLSVVLLSGLNGAALALAVSYMSQTSVSRVWVVGLVWAVVLSCAIERLVLQVSVDKRRWIIAVVIPRVALSLALAFQLSEPSILWMMRSEVGEQMAKTVAAKIQHVHAMADRVYDPQVTAKRSVITGIVLGEADLKKNIANEKRASGCRATLTICIQGGHGRCDASCQQQARLAKGDQSTFDRQYGGHRRAIKGLHKDIRSLKHQKKQAIVQQVGGIEHGGGLVAREQALSVLERTDGTVRSRVWYLRAFMLMVDLIPLISKLIWMFTGSPYEKNLAAARRADALGGKRVDADTRVQEKLIDEEARARINTGRRKIRERAAREAFDGTADPFGWRPQGDGPTPPGSGTGAEDSVDADVVDDDVEEPINAYSLEDLVHQMRTHEDGRVTIPDVLRRGSAIGMALILFVATLTTALHELTHQAIAGTWLSRGLLLLVLLLAGYTRGLRTAPAWGLQAAFATLIAGLTLPVLVLGLNIITI